MFWPAIYCTVNTCCYPHVFNGLFFSGLPGWAGTRKVKPVWILLKQETVSGSGISWAICKSAPRSRQITMPVPHHSVFYRPDALTAAQPTAVIFLLFWKYYWNLEWLVIVISSSDVIFVHIVHSVWTCSTLSSLLPNTVWVCWLEMCLSPVVVIVKNISEN